MDFGFGVMMCFILFVICLSIIHTQRTEITKLEERLKKIKKEKRSGATMEYHVEYDDPYDPDEHPPLWEEYTFAEFLQLRYLNVITPDDGSAEWFDPATLEKVEGDPFGVEEPPNDRLKVRWFNK